MAVGISHTIGVLVRGHNQLTEALVSAEASLLQFRKAAGATAAAVNRGLEPPGVDMSQVNKAAGELTSMGAKAMMTGGLMTAGLGLAVHAATTFNTAMAEVSTLVDTSKVNVGALIQTVKGLSREFGQAPVETAKALYTTISAGFTDANQAVVLLTGAMKLARGGLAPLETSIDGVTSVLNSYGLAADQITSVGDKMFVAMAAGKTTIGELAASLGRVTPLAATVGVSLDDLLAAVAALTLGGVSTAEAVTSIRGVLSSVARQTTEAKETSAKLGVEFSAGAIRAKGFAKWLAEIGAKSKGDQATLSSLFGEVESLTGVLALTGSQAGNFNSILAQMAQSGGATETAFRKIEETAATAFAKAGANVTLMRESIGDALLPMVSELARAVASVAGGFAGFAEAHPLLTKVGVTLVAVTAGVLVLGGAALIAGGQVMMAMAMVNVSTGGVLLAVGALVAGITGLVLLMTSSGKEGARSTGFLAKAWDSTKRAFYAMATPIAFGVGFLVGTLTRGWTAILEFTRAVWPPIATLVQRTFSAITTMLSPLIAVIEFKVITAWGIIKTLTIATWGIVRETVILAWRVITGVISVAWNVVTGIIVAGLQLLTADWSGAWTTITSRFGAAWESIKGIGHSIVAWLQGLGRVFADAGAGLMDAFMSGIKAGAERLQNSVLTIVKGVRALLPGSDAEQGPLKTLTASGRALLPTFARGIEAEADAPAVAIRAALKPAAANLDLASMDVESPKVSVPVPRGNTNGIVQDHRRTLVVERGAIVIQADSAAVAESLERQLEALLERLNAKWGPSYA